MTSLTRVDEKQLPKTMAAVSCYGPEDDRLEEHPIPGVGAGEVLKVRAGYYERGVVPSHELAKRCGADLGLSPLKGDVVAQMQALTDSYGCDTYIEASGHPSAVVQGLEMIRKLGTFVEFSMMRDPITVDWTVIGDTKELNIHGAHLSPYTYPVAIRMPE